MVSSRAGRKPKPSGIRLLEGNPGKRPINASEPKPEIKIPSCPKFLSTEARAEWKRIVPELKTLGLISEIDRAALAAYCQAWGTFADAHIKLKKTGPLYKTPGGCLVQSPLLGVANTALKHMRAYLVEFGMTPSSRSRLSVTPETGPEDPMGKYFK